MKSLQVGKCAFVMIIALRVGIGWHFFTEGANKFSDGFSSAGFLGAAKGPLANYYHSLVPDHDGQIRRNKEQTKKAWQAYRTTAASHFGFDDTQKAQAKRAYLATVAMHQHYLNDTAEDWADYRRQRVRLAEASLDGSTANVSYRRAWLDKQMAELNGKLRSMLAPANKLWDNYETRVNAIATSDQRRARGRLSIPRPGDSLLGISLVDKVIPYFDLIVGACLILGLFTPVVATAAALFLAAVISTQPPWIPGTASTIYQTVEMLALLMLASIGAGRFGGLDFVLGGLCGRCCGARKEG